MAQITDFRPRVTEAIFTLGGCVAVVDRLPEEGETVVSDTVIHCCGCCELVPEDSPECRMPPDRRPLGRLSSRWRNPDERHGWVCKECGTDVIITTKEMK